MREVTLKLKPILVDFLRFITQSEGEHIVLSRKISAGRLMFALLDKQRAPVLREKSPMDIVIQLSDVRYGNLNKDFLLLSSRNNMMFSDFIESVFDLEFHNFMVVSKRAGFNRENAITLFMEIYSIKQDAASIDALIKKDYRFRKKIHNLIIKTVEGSVKHDFKK